MSSVNVNADVFGVFMGNCWVIGCVGTITYQRYYEDNQQKAIDEIWLKMEILNPK